MLEFFRKYQRYFFVIITVVIVISFSFFGTYSTINSDPVRDRVVFTAVDGSNIKRSMLDEMVVFLSTDGEDKLIYGGAWGPNFLNDGTIKKDLLATGLGEILAAQYMGELAPDLKAKFEKEKRYNFYVHPQAKFINVGTVWGYFAPSLKSNYEAYMKSENPADPETFALRIRLFLAEKEFPAPVLSQVLRYQEKQNGAINPDPNLPYYDLSLFGYHTVDDWFGPRFMRLAAEFIINASKIAEQKGYVVTKEEALADLLRNAEISFQQNLNSPNLGVANLPEYFNEQLRRLGMDQATAVKVWRDVLLFRRLFDDVGDAVLVDPLTEQQFMGYSKESVKGDLYRLPKELRLGDYRTLQKLELYLNAVSKRSDSDMLALPKTYLTLGDVEKKYPELVQKQYLLEISSTNKRALQAKVSLKDTWNWEVEDKNWEALKKQFPELGVKKGATREERVAALDSLDEMTRTRVDTFARSAIVDDHPEWLEKVLDETEGKVKMVGISSKGENSAFAGLKSGDALMKALDAQPNLTSFTADNNTFYRITVLDRAPNKQILTFAEAKTSGLLDQLLDRDLETYYQQIRDVNAADFQNEDKSWKPLSDVEDKVAEKYFAKTMKALQESSEQKSLPGDHAAVLRLLSHAKDIKDKIQKDPTNASAYIRTTEPLMTQKDKLPPRKALEDQWKLEKESVQLSRGGEDDVVEKGEVYALSKGAWTNVRTPPNGDIYFFQLQSKGANEEIVLNSERVLESQQLLSYEAQRHYMKKALQEIKEKNAISLEYLNQPVETIESEIPQQDSMAE